MLLSKEGSFLYFPLHTQLWMEFTRASSLITFLTVRTIELITACRCGNLPKNSHTYCSASLDHVFCNYDIFSCTRTKVILVSHFSSLLSMNLSTIAANKHPALI